MKNFSKFILLSILVGVLSFAYVWAWTNPTSNPNSGSAAIGTDNAPENSIFINSDGNVGIGTTSPGADLEISRSEANPYLNVVNTQATTAKYPSLRVTNYGLGHPFIGQLNARGTEAAPSAMTAGTIGTFIGFGYDGSSFIQSGRISFVAEDTFAANYNPTAIVFKPGSGGSYAEKMRITSAGNVGIGTTSPGSLLDVNGTAQLRGAAGGTGLYVDGGGNVGIATTTPSYRLDLAGGDIGNVNKISVDTIDPIFRIGNQKYATFAPDIIGKKVMVSGQGRLKNGIFEVDLKKQNKGSDLWLFYHIVKNKTIIPIITAQDSSSLYSYLNDSKFIVKLKNGKKDSKFSYLLIGQRVDSKKNENLVPKPEKASAFIDVNKYKK